MKKTTLAKRLKVLDELAKQAQELKMGYGADDPVPSVFDKIRAIAPRQKPVPKTTGNTKKISPRRGDGKSASRAGIIRG
jgi:hypothetical protein